MMRSLLVNDLDFTRAAIDAFLRKGLGLNVHDRGKFYTFTLRLRRHRDQRSMCSPFIVRVRLKCDGVSTAGMEGWRGRILVRRELYVQLCLQFACWDFGTGLPLLGIPLRSACLFIQSPPSIYSSSKSDTEHQPLPFACPRQFDSLVASCPESVCRRIFPRCRA